MTKVNYVPTVIQWTDKQGKVQQRTVNIEEGLRLNISGKKNYTAKAYEYNGKKPLLSLSQEEAYSILGFSRMNDDKVTNSKGDVYTLDSKDFTKAHEAYGSSISNFNYLDQKVKGFANSSTMKNLSSAGFAFNAETNEPVFNEFQMKATNGTKISIFMK